MGLWKYKLDVIFNPVFIMLRPFLQMINVGRLILITY